MLFIVLQLTFTTLPFTVMASQHCCLMASLRYCLARLASSASSCTILICSLSSAWRKLGYHYMHFSTGFYFYTPSDAHVPLCPEWTHVSPASPYQVPLHWLTSWTSPTCVYAIQLVTACIYHSHCMSSTGAPDLCSQVVDLFPKFRFHVSILLILSFVSL